MKITLLDDKILVRPIQAEDKTDAGIIIPKQAKERPNEGVIEEVGPGSEEYQMIAKPKDKILFGKHAGTEVSLEGKIYLIMRQTDILAIL